MNQVYNYLSKFSLLIFLFCVTVVCVAQNTKISGGNTFSMALCQNGSVLTWGKNDHGQMALGSSFQNTIFDVPTAIPTTYGPVGSQFTLPAIVAVDAGTGSTAYALDINGKVWAWGEDSCGQMGSNTTFNSFNEIPRTVKKDNVDLINVKAINGGNHSGYALLNDGSVVSWGSNTSGQLGRGNANNDRSVGFVYKSDGVKLTNIKQIEAFDYGCMALDESGYVWTWGEVGDGQLGRSVSGSDNCYAMKVRKYDRVTGEELSNIDKISAGDKFALALDKNRRLWSWGTNYEGQLGRIYGEWSSANQVMANNLKGTYAVSLYTKFKPDDGRYYYGSNFTLPVTDPEALRFMKNVKDIAAGQSSSVALLTNGMVSSWGSDYLAGGVLNLGYGTLGRISQPQPKVSTAFPNYVLKNATTRLTGIVSVSDGDGWYFAIDASANTWCWGTNFWRNGSVYGGGGAGYAGFLGLGSTQTGNKEFAVVNPNFSVASCLISCPQVSIYAPPIVCKNGTTYQLTGTPAGGQFSGSGVSGSVFNPNSLAPGEYIITYTVNNLHASCIKSAKTKIVVPPAATMLSRVLSISAGTYNDAWPVDASVPLSPISYYAQGIKSGWAPEESHAYVDDRSQATGNLNLKIDGTMSSVPMFNWNFISNGDCYPNWRKINTITQIASGTGQTENKDILNTYDAAIFGYKDQLSLATAYNAQYKEITYDGFEEYTPNTALTITSQLKNNLTLLNTKPTSLELNLQYFEYEIIQAIDNVIKIDCPSDNLYLLTDKLAGVFGAGATTNTDKKIQGYFSILKAEFDLTAQIVIITLNSDEFTYTGIWKGKISLPNIIDSEPVFDIPTQAAAPNVVTAFAVATKRKAHTGEKFLRVTANTEIEQLRMQLTPLKKYVISFWISTDEVYPATFAASSKARGISIDFLDVEGNKISESPLVFDPTDSPGNIIEGWQRVEGTFTVPAYTSRFTLRFLTPQNTATYFDDLRIFPSSGNLQSYVYSNKDYKLKATLDQNNFATFYYYDEQGALYLVKKETERGIETIQEVFMHQTEINK